MYKILLFFCFIAICTSCETPTGNRSLLPNSAGEVDEVLLIMDEDQWQNGKIGESVRNIFMRDFLLLPQPEPLLDLRQVIPREFLSLLQKASTILVVGNLDSGTDTADMINASLEKIPDSAEKRFFYFVRKDVWASPQQVIYIFGNTEEELLANLDQYKEKIIQQIYELEDQKALRNAYASGVSEGQSNFVSRTFDIKLDIPKSFVEVVKTDNFIWFREDLLEDVSNLFIYALPADGTIPLDVKKGIAMRDSVGKNYVQSQTPNSYMKTTFALEPVSKELLLDGQKIIETRGLWRMSEEFMGGPFINYLVHHKKTNQLLLVEGFVYAPASKKRKNMRRLETMIKNMDLD